MNWQTFLQHPDKHRGDDASKVKSTTKFQAISAIHAILSNAEARALYDETGSIGSPDDMEDSASFDMWVDYFARIFPKVTEEDITKFEQEYRFSEEERGDVVEAYKSLKGSMQDILDSIMLCTEDDEERFAEMIETELKSNKEMKVYSQWKEYRTLKAAKPKKVESEVQKKKRLAKKDKEAKEADDLMAMIRNNKQQRAHGSGATSLTAKRERDFSSLIAGLESKYSDAPKSKKGKKKPAQASSEEMEEPSEEAFLAAQKRLTQGKSKSKRK